jgi:hypothetical protein
MRNNRTSSSTNHPSTRLFLLLCSTEEWLELEFDWGGRKLKQLGKWGKEEEAGMESTIQENK